MCSNLCEDNFISIYEKLDNFKEKIMLTLNKTSVDVSKELKNIIDEMTIALVIKTKLNMEKISQHHARLEATSRVLEQLLQVPNEQELITQSVHEERHTNRGLNVYQFIILSIVFLCIGINFEIIRNRRKEYTEIL